MQIDSKQLNETKIQLSLAADAKLIDEVKTQTLNSLRGRVKLPGFRSGKAPLTLIEKNVDQNLLQTEFLENAINRMYADAVTEKSLRPVAQPNVALKKFVPFTTLEVEAEVDVIGDIKLPDYTKIKVDKPTVKVTAKDVDEVIDNLKTRTAEKKDVDRAAQAGDQVWIDFVGTDAKTGEAIKGADGKDYPLLLGSNTFIPGFEDNLMGVKPGDEKEFTLRFPKDYGVKALQGRKVTFKTTVIKVQEVVEPTVDDAFAATVGPFKSLAELKSDIKKQLQVEKQAQTDREYEGQVLTALADKTKVTIPPVIVDEELDRIEQDERQNLMYRGQTWQEHLAAEGVTEEEHREKNREPAEQRVKAGLVMAEVAAKENITVTEEELAIRMQLLRGQYADPKMQAELDKPSAKREIANRIVSEKTLAKLTEYAQKS